MRVVVALGGNALVLREAFDDGDTRAVNLGRAADTVAALAESHELVVTHGNGPQVGNLRVRTGVRTVSVADPLRPNPVTYLG